MTDPVSNTAANTAPIVETPAGDTIKTHYSGAGAMAGMMNLMGSWSNSDQVEFFKKSLEKYNPDGMDKQVSNLASIKSTAKIKMPMPKLDCKEDLDAVFAGSDLTEEAKKNFATLFESAVDAKVAILRQALSEDNEVELEKAYIEIAEDLQEKVDDYVSEAVADWAEENKVALEAGARVEKLEQFAEGIRKAFAESYIVLPEEKADLVKDLETKIAELSAKLDEQTNAKISLQKTIDEQKKADIAKTVSEGLTVTQVEKFNQLVEAFMTDDNEAFEKKAKLVRETYFKVAAPTKTDKEIPGVDVLNENANSNPVAMTGPMARYMKHIDRVAGA